jgi:hypothetical protein
VKIEADLREFDQIGEMLNRRAGLMVQDAISEGKQRADSYAAAGGQRVGTRTFGARTTRTDWRKRSFHAGTRVTRPMRASGALIGWMAEKVFYRRFLDFWGDW